MINPRIPNGMKTKNKMIVMMKKRKKKMRMGKMMSMKKMNLKLLKMLNQGRSECIGTQNIN
jgi:hypothetical protein